MVVEQTVKCPHCGFKYVSQLEFTTGQPEAAEQCTGCRKTIYFRIQTAADGKLDGIEIHPRKI